MALPLNVLVQKILSQALKTDSVAVFYHVIVTNMPSPFIVVKKNNFSNERFIKTHTAYVSETWLKNQIALKVDEYIQSHLFKLE